MNRNLLAATSICLVAVVLAGCDVPKEVGAVSPPVDSNPQKVDAKTYGKDWPLSVDSGIVKCEIADKASYVTFEAPDGRQYALNGSAESEKKLPNIDELVTPDGKRTVWTLRSLGVRVCTVTK